MFSKHNFKDFMAFVGEMTLAKAEVIALDTVNEPGPVGHGAGPETTGQLWSHNGDAYRWVHPPPTGYNLGQDKVAQMAVQVMQAAPGKMNRSPWLSIEDVPAWLQANPAKQ